MTTWLAGAVNDRDDVGLSATPGTQHRTLSPLLLIGVVALLGAGVVWLFAVPLGPEVCALILPAPRNCFTSDRIQAAIAPTIVLFLVAVGLTVAAARLPRARRRIVIVGSVALITIAGLSYLHVAWIPALV
ncbi:hypothetical protein [Microbacterium sp. B35-04]|uniref:hypothetical protein n=1 Tax=Microbacterium sp. B35-04 TaxID=1961716 RepID=UPI0013D25EAE|nr:hypothetical protein [Microbacterium sp. B35-04]